MPEIVQTAKQWAIINRWLPSLQQIPAIDVIWLEGSLSSAGRGHQGSDIDLRLAIADDAYAQLWETDRTPLLAGLGEHVVVKTRVIRAITADAVTVEVGASRTSEVNGQEQAVVQVNLTIEFHKGAAHDANQTYASQCRSPSALSGRARRISGKAGAGSLYSRTDRLW